jgi:hypothetical protein
MQREQDSFFAVLIIICLDMSSDLSAHRLPIEYFADQIYAGESVYADRSVHTSVPGCKLIGCTHSIC